MTHAGFITGLAAESRALTRGAKAHDAALEPRVACAGAKPARARAQAERLIAEGATVLVSFGVAGGLDPALSAGTLLLPESVDLGDGERVPADPGLHARLHMIALSSGAAMALAPLIGSDRVVATVTGKQELFQRSGAAAVDMESHVVAGVAKNAGVRYLVIRAVVDAADATLPSSVLGAVTPQGHSRGGLVAARLCLKPWEISTVRRLRTRMISALATLERFTEAAAPVLFGRL